MPVDTISTGIANPNPASSNSLLPALASCTMMSETFYILVSPHTMIGSIQIIAGAQTMTGLPDFYRLEVSLGALQAYDAVLAKPLDIRDSAPDLDWEGVPIPST